MNRKYFDRGISKLRSAPFGIFTDQAGFLPESSKRAVLPFECGSFEIKYELDLLLKMQRPDGAVYHKAATMQHWQAGYTAPSMPASRKCRCDRLT